MTSNHHAPYVLGYTRATMVGTEGSKRVILSESQKADPSSDCRLQLAYVKSESLVIAGQHTAVNTFRALYTPPVTPRKSEVPKAGGVTFGSQPSKVKSMIGVEVVTR